MITTYNVPITDLGGFQLKIALGFTIDSVLHVALSLFRIILKSNEKGNRRSTVLGLNRAVSVAHQIK